MIRKVAIVRIPCELDGYHHRKYFDKIIREHENDSGNFLYIHHDTYCKGYLSDEEALAELACIDEIEDENSEFAEKINLIIIGNRVDYFYRSVSFPVDPKCIKRRTAQIKSMGLTAIPASG